MNRPPLDVQDFNSGQAGADVGFGATCASTARALRSLARQFELERLHPHEVSMIHRAPADDFHSVELRLEFHDHGTAQQQLSLAEAPASEDRELRASLGTLQAQKSALLDTLQRIVEAGNIADMPHGTAEQREAALAQLVSAIAQSAQAAIDASNGP